MALRKYDVYIERTTPAEDSKLVVVQFPAIKSQLDRDPDELTLSMMNKSLKMKIELCDVRKSRNVYLSSSNNIDDSQLFIGKIVNDRLVCHPVTQIVTMRPDFSHLNPKEEVDPNEEIRPVSVKFSANDRHHTQSKFQDRSQPDEELEVFHEYNFRNLRGKYATQRREALFGKQTKIKPDPDADTCCDAKWNIKMFVPDVKPKIEKMDIDSVYSDDTKNKMPIPQKRVDLIKQRVKECLIKAKLASFEEIYRFLECYQENALTEQLPTSKKDIIDALNEYGVLVQGNWAVKSDILYGDSGDRECTDVTGIPINLFTAARDYLLWLFDQKRLVSRPAYSRRVKIPDHDVIELFNQVADYRPNVRKWEFKLKTDKQFMLNCPEVVDRQRAVWRVTRNNKLKIFD
uniref:DNA-directed RNA polymerase III subunit RPC5 n=1 Tax=Aceria tosichella TaxID=561515 RepID=A0A6G1SN81_9ACAR